jgi:hypothetical protein
MAHTGIFATKAECDSKVGEMVDATGWSEANINSWCAMAESYINVASRKNWSDAYAGLNADVKAILSDTASNLVAMYGIQYNMGGYSKLAEAQTMLNVLYTRVRDNMILLEKMGNIDWMGSA